MTEISMRIAEMDRLFIIRQVASGELSQQAASTFLGLSTRQVRRLQRRVSSEGAEGIKARYKGGNRAFDSEVRTRAVSAIRDRYRDFGPTLASEKLAEHEKIDVSRETLRHWMIAEGLWIPHVRRKARIHQGRPRRSCFGELVQIDGSHHDWFEGRGPKCCLLVFIDDATGRLVEMLFVSSETTQGYFEAVFHHLMRHGRPMAYYSDKYSVFKVNRKDCVDGRLEDTQFQRAMRTLGIELICADSPQAKGRVERANQTLQDRLIKEMRLRGISSIEAANDFVPAFISMFNEKFARIPAIHEDRHRPPLCNAQELRQILCVRMTRKVSKNLEISLEGETWQIQNVGNGYRLRHKQITICKHFDGNIEFLNDDRLLTCKKLNLPRRTQTAGAKQIQSIIDQLEAKQSTVGIKTHEQHALSTNPQPSLACYMEAQRKGCGFVDNTTKQTGHV